MKNLHYLGLCSALFVCCMLLSNPNNAFSMAQIPADFCSTDSQCDPGSTCNVEAERCEENCASLNFTTRCGQILRLDEHVSTESTFQLGATISCLDGIFTVSAYDVCATSCGDNICVAGEENCSSCPGDCGQCSEIEPANILNPEPLTSTDIFRSPCPIGQSCLPASTLDSEDVTFEWSSGNLSNTYRLELGSCIRPNCTNDIFDGTNPHYIFQFQDGKALPPSFPNAGATAHTVSDIPLDGKPLHVRLTTFGGERPYVEQYLYNRVNVSAHILNPNDGQVLSTNNLEGKVTFHFDPGYGVVPSPNHLYYLRVGSTVKGGEYLEGAVSSDTSVDVYGIPADKSKVYAIFIANIDGKIVLERYQYTSMDPLDAAAIRRIKLLGDATDAYIADNGGAFPESVEDLIDSDGDYPPYLEENDCGKILDGHEITCVNTSSSYAYTATPAGPTPGNITLTRSKSISCGGFGCNTGGTR